MHFPILFCPRNIRRVADDFKDIVGNQYRALTAVLCAAVFGIAGFCTINRFLLFSPSVSALSRFFNSDELWRKLNRRHRRRLLKLLEKARSDPGRYLWAIDDTLIPHWGKQIWGAYYWHNHGNGGTVFGHRLMVVGLVDRKRRTLIPVFWEIVHRKQDGKPHQKGWEVALKLLDDALAMGFPKFSVVADSWFAGEDFFEALIGRNLDFVIEIKSNRVVQHHGRRSVEQHVNDFFSDRTRGKISYRGRKKWATEAVLRFRDAKQSLKTVMVANKKGLAHEPFAFYVSNKLTWNASQIWAITRDRWTIEVQFRELKQLFTLGGAAVRSQNAVETSISITAIALSVIRLQQESDANENQHDRPKPAGEIVRDLQLSSLKRGISKLAQDNPSLRGKLMIRMNPTNFGRKPAENRKTQLNPTRQASQKIAA